MTDKHTPGPWWLAGASTIRCGDSKTGGWIGRVNWRNRDANARLMVAAPDMLAADAAIAKATTP